MHSTMHFHLRSYRYKVSTDPCYDTLLLSAFLETFIVFEGSLLFVIVENTIHYTKNI
jgi:hypothetical protein